MPQSNAVDLKYTKSFLLGTSALVCLALAAPVMADDFVITSGTSTNDGNTINTGDTVTVTGALTTTGTDRGIEPSGVGTNTVIVSETGNITAGGDGINADDGNTVIINGNVTSATFDGVDLKANNTITVGSSGSITANDDGIEAENGNTVVINGNVTSTTDDGVDLIANNTITVGSSGSITAKDNGIEAENGNTVNIFGTVVAEDDHGIDLGSDDSSTSGGNVVVIHAGAVVRGDPAVQFDNGRNTLTVLGLLDGGFEAVGQNNEITISSSGRITTTGNYRDGIQNDGDNNTTTVSGSITTTGNYAEGIDNNGDNNTTTISGSIATTGNYAEGIDNNGDNNTTTVSGSITTGVVGTIIDGDNATGVYNSGTGNTTTLTSTGVITVRGPIADGIYNDGGTSTTIVHGSINVTGHGAGADYTTGVDNRGGNTQTTLSKSSQIITTGNRSVAVYAQENNNITNMHGYISVSGDWSDGISNWGNNNINNISGSISATGTTNSNAILVYSGSGNSFTLDEGAVIIGDITADAAATNNKLKFNLGEGLSYAYSVGGGGAGTGAGQWTFTDQDGRTQGVTTDGTGCDTTITVCNLVTGVSTGNVEAQDELQFSMNSSMIGSLEFGSGQADAPAEAMSFTQSSKSNTWTNVYGGTSKRASSTTKLAFDTSNRGLTIGTPVSINDTLDVDLVFNVSRTSLDIGLTKDQEITSNSYNLGAVLRDLAPSTGWAVDAFGFIGRNFYDGKRKVMNNQEATGSETVTAAYSGSEVLVGVDAQYSNPINDTLNFIGGVNASLSNEKIGAYSESKYYSWDARTMAQASGGITAGLEYHTDALTTFANLGVQGMSQRSGKTATYTNNGTAGSYTNNSRGDIYRTASVGFDYKAEDGLSFTGAIERFSSTGGVSGNSASLTANWSF
jgi:hypothetical protein